MAMLCIFEDDAYSQFYPLTYTRPVYELLCGITSLREKIHRAYYGCPLVLQCRASLATILKAEQAGLPVNALPSGDYLFVNGRILPDADLAARIPADGERAYYVHGDTLVAARLPWSEVTNLDVNAPLAKASLMGGCRIEIDVRLVSSPWELIDVNGAELQRDFEALHRRDSPQRSRMSNVSCLHPEDIHVGGNVTIKPGVVLDAGDGPVHIGNGAVIGANAVIAGPASVGAGTQVKAGSRISGGTTLGSVCRIGGEVSSSVFMGYSNKQHDGYLGHAYIGSWVNLGAGTTNSDLKNTYRPVKVQLNGRLIDTGLLFVGCIIGDHSKTGINTMLNTGTIVGLSCNIFGAGFPPKFIPSFSWVGQGTTETYELERAIETARTVMGRRSKVLSKAGEALMRQVYELTAPEREHAASGPGRATG